MSRNKVESRLREGKQFEKSLWLTDGRKSAMCKASLAEVLINILILMLINYSLDSTLQSRLSLPELTARMALLLWAESALSVSRGNLKLVPVFECHPWNRPLRFSTVVSLEQYRHIGQANSTIKRMWTIGQLRSILITNNKELSFTTFCTEMSNGI